MPFWRRRWAGRTPAQPANTPLPGGRLPRVFHAPHLAHHRDLDLAGVLHFLLDLLGDVAGYLGAGEVVQELGVHDDADLAAGLDRVGLADAVEGHRQFLQVAEALDVAFEAL